MLRSPQLQGAPFSALGHWCLWLAAALGADLRNPLGGEQPQTDRPAKGLAEAAPSPGKRRSRLTAMRRLAYDDIHAPRRNGPL